MHAKDKIEILFNDIANIYPIGTPQGATTGRNSVS